MEGGIEALGQLKGAYGGEGEGVREFCSLALGVVKEGEDGGKGVLEEEMRAEGVRVVRELLQGQL